MYNDYGTKFESRVNEYEIPILIGLGIFIVVEIITLIATSKMFKKANRSGVAAFIPVYNIFVLFEIANKEVWKSAFFLLSIFGYIASSLLNNALGTIIFVAATLTSLVVYFNVMFKVAKAFRKTDMAAIGTCVFPFVFIPIIGFGDSEYIGINKEAFSGESIAIDLPQVTEKDIVAEEVRNVTETKPMDISIGGGVYQKEYKDSLLEVPEENINKEKLAPFRVNEETPVIKKEKQEQSGADLFNTINYVHQEEPKVENQNEIENPVPNPVDQLLKQAQPSVGTMDQLLKSTQSVSNELTSTASIQKAVSYQPVEPVPVEISQPVEVKPIEEEKKVEEAKPKFTDPGVCPQCGFKIKEGSKKCFMCGKDL